MNDFAKILKGAPIGNKNAAGHGGSGPNGTYLAKDIKLSVHPHPTSPNTMLVKHKSNVIGEVTKGTNYQGRSVWSGTYHHGKDWMDKSINGLGNRLSTLHTMAERHAKNLNSQIPHTPVASDMPPPLGPQLKDHPAYKEKKFELALKGGVGSGPHTVGDRPSMEQMEKRLGKDDAAKLKPATKHFQGRTPQGHHLRVWALPAAGTATRYEKGATGAVEAKQVPHYHIYHRTSGGNVKQFTGTTHEQDLKFDK